MRIYLDYESLCIDCKEEFKGTAFSTTDGRLIDIARGELCGDCQSRMHEEIAVALL